MYHAGTGTAVQVLLYMYNSLRASRLRRRSVGEERAAASVAEEEASVSVRVRATLMHENGRKSMHRSARDRLRTCVVGVNTTTPNINQCVQMRWCFTSLLYYVSLAQS